MFLFYFSAVADTGSTDIAVPMEDYRILQKVKHEPRGRKRADFHGGSNNQLSWGSEAAQERQKLLRLDALNRTSFGRKQSTKAAIHGPKGNGMNLGSDSLQKMMEEHHENVKLGSQSLKRLKHKKKMEKAVTLIAERWRAKKKGLETRRPQPLIEKRVWPSVPKLLK